MRSDAECVMLNFHKKYSNLQRKLVPTILVGDLNIFSHTGQIIHTPLQSFHVTQTGDPY